MSFTYLPSLFIKKRKKIRIDQRIRAFELNLFACMSVAALHVMAMKASLRHVMLLGHDVSEN